MCKYGFTIHCLGYPRGAGSALWLVGSSVEFVLLFVSHVYTVVTSEWRGVRAVSTGPLARHSSTLYAVSHRFSSSAFSPKRFASAFGSGLSVCGCSFFSCTLPPPPPHPRPPPSPELLVGLALCLQRPLLAASSGRSRCGVGPCLTLSDGLGLMLQNDD